MCLYNHTDSPSSVVSASSNRRGTKNEPKVAKTHSSVGMLHFQRKIYVTCMCLYIHTDSPSSVVSASSSQRGTKNEPKVAKTHSSVGMLHLLTKDYVTCACKYIQTLPLLCQQVVVEGVQRMSPRWPRHILLWYVTFY